MEQPRKRLGHSESDSHEIKIHPFFKDIDWDQVSEKKYSPPFKPKLLNEQDLRYFDKALIIYYYSLTTTKIKRCLPMKN